MATRFSTKVARIFCLGLAVSFATELRAGPIADAFISIEELLEAGEESAAWEALNRATELFWAEAPMVFRRALLVESAAGYGQYQPRTGADYRSGDRMLVYLEPIGFGWTAIGDEYRIRLTLDVEIAIRGGPVLLTEDAFALIERLSRERGREFQATASMAVPDLPPGLYSLGITMRDAATGKSVTTAIDFAIVE